GRRVPAIPGTLLTAADVRQLQIAVFVRRIDLNIRVPRANFPTNPPQPITLRDVLLNRNLQQPTDFCLPVCAYPSTAGPLAYLPTNNGTIANSTPRYSLPVLLDQNTGVTPVFDPDHPTWLEFTGMPSTDNRWKLISLVGQKLLDNLGNV